MATQQSSSGIELKLHPLVIINITDHWTRTKIRTKEKRSFGVLLGTLEGRVLEIHTSFELAFSGPTTVDIDYMMKKKDQYSKVFPKYELVGWYSTGATIQPEDEIIHKQLSQFIENAIYLLCRTAITSDVKDLPVQIFETTTGEKGFQWLSLDYKIETEESERIAVHHVTHQSTDQAAATTSGLIPRFASLHSAVRMLNLRINLILQYLEEATKKGEPINNELLRLVNGLCNKLADQNNAGNDEFEYALMNESNENLLITYLSSLTKATSMYNEVVEKFNTINSSKRMRGLMF